MLGEIPRRLGVTPLKINDLTPSNLGWIGNKKEDVKEVSRRISILKSKDDCPNKARSQNKILSVGSCSC